MPPVLLADTLSQGALDVLKYAFLALLYLFLFRVVRVVVLELRSPAAVASVGGGTSAPGRAKRAGARLKVLEPADRRGETYPLGDELTVGRGGGCGVGLPQHQVLS